MVFTFEIDEIFINYSKFNYGLVPLLKLTRVSLLINVKVTFCHYSAKQHR